MTQSLRPLKPFFDERVPKNCFEFDHIRGATALRQKLKKKRRRITTITTRMVVTREAPDPLGASKKECD